MAEEIFELNNGDDCTSILTPLDKDGVSIAGNPDVDFEVWYYTIPQYIYKAYRIDGVLSDNCSIDGDTIRIYIDRFNWGKLGRAYIRVFLAWVDPAFPDGKRKSSSKQKYSKIKVI